MDEPLIRGVAPQMRDQADYSGRSPLWVKVKNPNAPAVKREAEEDWGSPRWIKKQYFVVLASRSRLTWFVTLLVYFLP